VYEINGKASQPVSAFVVLASHRCPPARLCASAAALIIGKRLSPLDRPVAMPSNIHARLRFSPTKCANLGSLGSGLIL